MTRRVAITGTGILSALGRGTEAHVDAVCSSRSGTRALDAFDATGFVCRVAAQVDSALIGDASGEYDRFTRLALTAAADATLAAAFDRIAIDPERIGCIVGTGLGGSSTLEAAYQRMYGENNSRLHPATIPRAMYNAATSAISVAHQAKGPGFTIVSACSSATHAIGQAFHWIRSGVADAVLCGGADAPLVPGVVRGWEALRVMANDPDPSRACRPFCAERKGMVLGEGAAIVVLEEMENARARGAEILGELIGFGLSLDAGHLTDPSPDGAARAIRAAIGDAGIDAAEVGYVNAHGTATRANDPTETTALKRALGEYARVIPVSSTKAMHGHAMGASGAIELVLTLAALNAGVIPPTINFGSADPACDLDYVPNEAREGEVKLFLSNSFGFGGMNAVVAVRTARE